MGFLRRLARPVLVRVRGPVTEVDARVEALERQVVELEAAVAAARADADAAAQVAIETANAARSDVDRLVEALDAAE